MPQYSVVGVAALDGAVRPVRGVLAAAILARAAGMRSIIVPELCGAEAGVVDGIAVHPVADLGELVAALRGECPLRAPGPDRLPSLGAATVDMAEIRGQSLARAAVEIAVAGGHNVLLAGPPGTGIHRRHRARPLCRHRTQAGLRARRPLRSPEPVAAVQWPSCRDRALLMPPARP